MSTEADTDNTAAYDDEAPSLPAPVPAIPPPLPPSQVVAQVTLAHDDSLDRAREKQMQFEAEDGKPDAERDSDAALSYDDSTITRKKGNVKLSTIDDSTPISVPAIPPPMPPSQVLAQVAFAHDDSLDRVREKQRQFDTEDRKPDAERSLDLGEKQRQNEEMERPAKDNLDRIHEPELEHDSDVQPTLQDGNDLPQTISDAGDDNDSKADEGDQRDEGNEDIITADVQTTMSPFISESGRVCIPEATAVEDTDIPSAEIVRPDKYSLTIAGHRLQLRFLVLGVLVVFAAAIAVAVTLSRQSVDVNSEVTASVPSSTPSVSLSPSLYPSTKPSMSPTSALQAELVSLISKYSGDDNNSTSMLHSSIQSTAHRDALSWLVADQAKWRAEKEPLSNAEVMERFVLALLHFETNGKDWSEQWGFLTEDHACLWRGRFKEPVTKQWYQKGVIRCDNKTSGRIQNLTLWNNDLLGSLPAEIGLLNELTSLHIHENRMYGNLPESLRDLAKITHLEMNGNDFTGPIDILAPMKTLQFINLSRNRMSGSLFDPANLTKLKSFMVSSNKFSGAVPEAFSDISSLETLHLDFNGVSGNVDFLCEDLPSDFGFDCYGDKPEIECRCCIGCTFISDEECDPSTEKMLSLDIFAGDNSNGFKWEIFEHGDDGDDDDDTVSFSVKYGDDDDYGYIQRLQRQRLLASGGEYSDGQQLTLQMCLPYPQTYNITIVTAMLQTNLTGPYNGAKISFSIDGYSSSIDSQNQGEKFNVTARSSQSPSESPSISVFPSISVSPSFVPTISVRPTTSSFPSAPTISPTSPPSPIPTSLAPTEVGTTTVGFKVCGPKFKLDLTTDAFGMDTSWKVIDRNFGWTSFSKSGLPSDETISFEECLLEYSCYDFVIEDAWDDGICCQFGQGKYSVWVDGVLKGSGGEFGSSETVDLGCIERPTNSPTSSSQPTITPRPTFKRTPIPTFVEAGTVKTLAPTPFPDRPPPGTPFPTEPPVAVS